MLKKIPFFSYLLFFLLAVGCSSNTENFHSSKSLGEQLNDLDKAYQANAITENEYKKAKGILLDYYK